MDTINWGILAPGTIAGQFASAMSVVPNSKILAVASRSAERARVFADKFSIDRVHNSYEDLISDPNVNAIYISSVNSVHKEQVLQCLSGKKAVLCEKPLAVNAEQVRELIHCAKENKAFLMEALWTRFLPSIRDAQKFMSDIGEVKRLVADFSSNHALTDNHRCINLELGGGALLDLGVYVLHIARMFTENWPVDSQSFAQIYKTGVDIHTVMVLKYGNNALAQLSCAFNVLGNCTAVVYGSRGTIEIPRRFHSAQKIIIQTNKGERIINKPFKKNGFEYEIEEVNACLRAGKTESTILPLSESLKITEQMDQFRAQWGLRYPNE